MPADGDDEIQILDQATAWMWELLEDGICYLDFDRDPPAVKFFEFASREVRHVAPAPEATSYGFAVSPDRLWVVYQKSGGNRDIVLVENFR
jgi:hypothetical protein